MILPENEAVEYCNSMLGTSTSKADLALFRKYGIVPTLGNQRDVVYVQADLDAVVPNCSFAPPLVDRLGQRLLFQALNSPRIRIGRQTTVDLPEDSTSTAYSAALRNLIEFVARKDDASQLSVEEDGRFLSACRITTTSESALRMAESQRARSEVLLSSMGGEFVNSANYMGSKRALTPFIVEALSSEVPCDGTVVDLMCGSGVVAGACARFWPVIASDAQAFSRCLAVVQGGGFSRARARGVLERVLAGARENLLELSQRIAAFLNTEEELFHAELDTELRAAYADFVECFPTLGAGIQSDGWDPSFEVELRRAAWRRRPYLLCTAYFANVYFGLRQAVEIDSLRFGIDSLEDDIERTWALGALVACASKVATSYAGHFAEPRVHDWRRIGLKQLGGVIEKRTHSVIHEFSVRLLNLADESERTEYPVATVPGPWAHALQQAERVVAGRPVVVYFDPPYRREEYSRYYHVLETFVDYSYPSVSGRGRTPNKGPGGRFASEFFTRAEGRKKDAIVAVIEAILRRGWTCAWNYSNVADVSIPDVLRHIQTQNAVSIKCVSTEHRHQSHRSGTKAVLEYVIMIRPEPQ